MAAKNKSFDDWSAQEVRLAFDIEQDNSLPLLKEWLSVDFEPNKIAKHILEEKRMRLIDNYRSWNEDELKFQFIAQIVELAALHGKNYNTFSQRRLSVVVNKILLSGKPEVMIATGREEPLRPYFFIHEYKPTKQTGDPLGQVLSAIVAAHALNADEKPILGCFVIAQTWQFLVFDGKNYAVSKNYDATEEDDLLKIYSALCQAKVYIEQRVK
jgi:hypothetical protein